MPLSMEAAIRKILAPRLRADGFTGSGGNFRRAGQWLYLRRKRPSSRYGAHDEAVAFARIAFSRLGGALGLKQELEELIAGTWTIEDWA